MNDVATPAPPLADTLDGLADELAQLPYLPETGGDGYLNRIIPLARAAASELRRLAAVETAALRWRAAKHRLYPLVQPVSGECTTDACDEASWELDAATDALLAATAAQPTAEGR